MIEYDVKIGWSVMVFFVGVVVYYVVMISSFDVVIIVYCCVEFYGVEGGCKSNNNGVVVVCSCGCKIRVFFVVFDVGFIVCGFCGDEFIVED